MKFPIKHRHTGAVLYEAELTAEFKTKSHRIQLGAAVKLALLMEADLGGADLGGADLRRANLRGADLWGADLWGADLWGADLREADLRGANLRGADLGGADLGGADLREANLRRANLWGANLADCGHDIRGYRFWAWQHKDGDVVYRAGCREWNSIEAAMAHYGEDYSSDGHVPTCLAKINALHTEALGRGWIKS